MWLEEKASDGQRTHRYSVVPVNITGPSLRVLTNKEPQVRSALRKASFTCDK